MSNIIFEMMLSREQRKLEEFGTAVCWTLIESEFVESEKYKVISIGIYSENCSR